MRAPPSGHGSLDTPKDSTSLGLKDNSFVPTQDIRIPQRQSTLELRNHHKLSPTQHQSLNLSQCIDQDDALPTPTLYTNLQRRLQKGRSRVASSLKEVGPPLELGANHRKQQDDSKSIECSRVPREAKGRQFHEGLEEDKKVGTGMSDVVQDPKPKPAVPMKPSAVGSQLLGYVGIDTIIEQMRRKTMKTGFDFNIMVVGQSGLGKSTLVNTLFKSQVSRKSCGRNREEKVPKTVEIRTVSHGEVTYSMYFFLIVRKELDSNGIEFYPQREFDEDMEDKMENDKIRETMPFAIVGSDTEYQINGKRVLGRKTPWGIIEVENVTHCEFPLLRDLIVRTHLQDLKEVTHNIFYETYRAKRLNENGNLANDTGFVPMPEELGVKLLDICST
ncbi:neuronal-specific septin-3-like [Rhincodon typus]|uniref:neuronal-specific septin-3-like n=1 Tax=Rhincodon typus TaxID=259920 RepID=UPI00202E5CB6|nr:neuronal-specific septin-3-like [Rhincodon typus]